MVHSINIFIRLEGGGKGRETKIDPSILLMHEYDESHESKKLLWCTNVF